MAFGVEEQAMLLAFIAYGDEAEARVAVELVPNTLYDGVYRKVHEKFHQYLKRFRSKLSTHVPDIITGLISAYPNSESDLVDVFNALAEHWQRGLNQDYVFSKARTYVSYRHWQDFVAKAAQIIAQPPDDERLLQVQELHRKTVTEVNAGLDIGISVKDTKRVNEALKIRPQDRFATGIIPLDKAQVCPTRGQLFMILGLSGAGKSTAIRHFVTHPWWHGGPDGAPVNVLLFALEQDFEDEIQVLFRARGLYSEDVDGSEDIKQVYFDVDKEGRANPSSMTKKTIKIVSDKAKRDALHEKIKTRGEFFIRSMPSRILTPDMVAATIDAIKSRQGVHIDVCAIDYLAGMKDGPGEEGRAYLNSMELRDVGRTMKTAMISGQQINRDGDRALANGQPITELHIEGDKRVINMSDKVVVLQQTESERRAQLARLWTAKGRQKGAKFWTVISQNYAAGRFAVSSGLLSMAWEKKIKDQAV